MTSLQDYHRKRNFKHTPEPKGKKKMTSSDHHFVVQMHAARHLHYDLRLEKNGVLKSWAVPKGPSLDPSIKRLAVQVEDHPIEYKDFEGNIPKGEYGSGTVMVWDQGTWCEVDDGKNLNKGALTFTLQGEKLKGKWKLIQIKSDSKNWLLIKAKDDEACAEDKYDILEEEPLSVLSGRSLAEIKQDPEDAFFKGVHTDKHSKQVLIEEADPVIELSHPNKLLYPKDNISKQDLAHFYQTIHEWILPHIIDRPISLLRCPGGITSACFYQKHLASKQRNPYLKTIEIQEKHKKQPYIYLDNVDGLLHLVQIGTIEIHPWSSNIIHIERPDYITFDLDPAEDVAWKEVVKAAILVKDELEKIGLQSFVKTTGGKGLHIVTPIQPRYEWIDVSHFAKAFAQYLTLKYPAKYIDTMSKVKRKGKIFVDYLRNQRGATAIAAYSTRARAGAPVSTPLSWQELSPKIHSDYYTLFNLPKRLHSLSKDPWENFFIVKQKLPSI